MVKVVSAVSQYAASPYTLVTGPKQDGASSGGDPKFSNRAAITVDLETKGRAWDTPQTSQSEGEIYMLWAHVGGQR